MLTVAIPKRNKLQNIIVLTPKDGAFGGAGKTFLFCIFQVRGLFLLPLLSGSSIVPVFRS